MNPSIAASRSGCTCTAESSPSPAARIAFTAAAVSTGGGGGGGGGPGWAQAARTRASVAGTRQCDFMRSGPGVPVGTKETAYSRTPALTAAAEEVAQLVHRAMFFLGRRVTARERQLPRACARRVRALARRRRDGGALDAVLRHRERRARQALHE